MSQLIAGTLFNNWGAYGPYANILSYDTITNAWERITYNLAPYEVWDVAFLGDYLFCIISSSPGSNQYVGPWWLDVEENEWKRPDWVRYDTAVSNAAFIPGVSDGPSWYATYATWNGQYFVAGEFGVLRLDPNDPRAPLKSWTADGDHSGDDNCVTIVTELSGQPELVMSYAWNDRFKSWDLQRLTDNTGPVSNVKTFEHYPSGSCGYALAEWEGVIWSGNEYGWVYKSTDGRFFNGIFEDLTTPHDVEVWCFFELDNPPRLYTGTCTKGWPSGVCDIRLFNGTDWSTSERVIIHPTGGQEGFCQGMQDPNEPDIAYVAVGWGFYDYNNSDPPTESRLYRFNGSTIVDVSPERPAWAPDVPNVRFDSGIHCMAFAERGRGQATITDASVGLSVSRHPLLATPPRNVGPLSR